MHQSHPQSNEIFILTKATNFTQNFDRIVRPCKGLVPTDGIRHSGLAMVWVACEGWWLAGGNVMVREVAGGAIFRVTLSHCHIEFQSHIVT